MAESLHDTEFLKRLEYLSLATRRLVRGLSPAQRRSAKLGGGVEFADHRPYSDGDDCRDVDWHAYARLGTLFIKRFQEEQDLSIYVMLDVSRSMAVGEPSKLAYARQVAAALAYIGLADLDRVALTAFSNRPVAEFPPTRGKNCILSLLKMLSGISVDHEPTNLLGMANQFVRRAPRRGLVAIISDWFDRSALEATLDTFRRNRFEVVAVQVYDPSEAEPPLKGDVELVDVETGDRRVMTITESKRRQYKQAFAQHRLSLLDYCKKYGFACASAATTTPLEDLVLGLIRDTPGAAA